MYDPHVSLAESPNLQASKQIMAILANDVDVTALIRALKDEKGILSAFQIACRGVGHADIVRSQKRFRPLPVKAMRMLTVIVPEDQADEIFDFLHEEGQVNRPSGGFVTMGPVEGVTLFTLPEGVEEEH